MDDGFVGEDTAGDSGGEFGDHLRRVVRPLRERTSDHTPVRRHLSGDARSVADFAPAGAERFPQGQSVSGLHVNPVHIGNIVSLLAYTLSLHPSLAHQAETATGQGGQAGVQFNLARYRVKLKANEGRQQRSTGVERLTRDTTSETCTA